MRAARVRADPRLDLSALMPNLDPLPGKYEPCIDNEVALYVNRADVQAAMHANTTGNVPGPWADCSAIVDYSRKDIFSSMLPVYKRLLKSGALSVSSRLRRSTAVGVSRCAQLTGAVACRSAHAGVQRRCGRDRAGDRYAALDQEPGTGC